MSMRTKEWSGTRHILCSTLPEPSDLTFRGLPGVTSSDKPLQPPSDISQLAKGWGVIPHSTARWPRVLRIIPQPYLPQADVYVLLLIDVKEQQKTTQQSDVLDILGS